MKILIAGDSFKGSISASQFVTTLKQVLVTEHQCICAPLCDGGEGTMEILTNLLHGNIISTIVYNASMRKSTARLGKVKDTFIVESAEAIGLPQAKKNILTTSSYGVGQLIRYAVFCKAKHIIITLGGTATNDGGAGMLCALGAKFYNNEGKEFVPTTGSLSDICKCDLSPAIDLLENIDVEILSDVENPLLGENGATNIFARQKGATEDQIPLLEKSLKHFYRVTNANMPNKNHILAGAGAGGGLGYGCMFFKKAFIKKGSDAVLDLISFDQMVKDVDWVVTGEGKFDSQSYMGKIVGNVIKRSKDKKIAVVCGIASGEMYDDKNINILLEIGNNNPDAMTNATHYLTQTAVELLSLLEQQP